MKRFHEKIVIQKTILENYSGKLFCHDITLFSNSDSNSCFSGKKWTVGKELSCCWNAYT